MRGKSMRMRNLAMAIVVIIAALSAALSTSVPASAGSVAGPSAKASVVSKSKLPIAGVSARKSTVSCDGQTFAHNGLSYGLGNGMRFVIGFGGAGNPRMVKVYTNNGSLANFALGPISYSGAVVESWAYNVPSYCVTFPGTTKGIVIRTRQGGVGTNDKIYW